MDTVASESLLNELQGVVGAAFVRADDVTRFTYAIEDFGGSFFYPLNDRYTAPDMVVIPHTTEEVSGIVKLANKYKIPIIARGGGHDMTGACTPLKGKGGIILDMTSMNKVLDYQQGMNAVHFQPGIRWGDLEHQLNEKGLTLGILGPHGLHGATLGAGVAHNCFSINAPKYGWPVQNVLTLQVVLPSGEVIETGSLANKDCKTWYFRCCNGPDMAGIFLGSGGAFGVITEIAMKTYPKPTESSTLAYAFKNIDDYLEFVHQVGWQQFVTELWGMALIGLHPKLRAMFISMFGQKDLVFLTIDGHEKGVFKAQVKAVKRIARENRGELIPIEGLMHAMGGSVIDKVEFAGGGYYGAMAGPNDNCTCSVTPVLNWKKVVTQGMKVIDQNMDALGGGFHMMGADKFYIFPLLLGGGNSCQSVVSTTVDYCCGGANGTKACETPIDSDKDREAKFNLKRAKELYSDMWEMYVENTVAPYRIGKENPSLIRRLKPEYYAFLKLIKQALDPNNIMNPGVIGLGVTDQEAKGLV
ncbi:MAG: FAD-binding oxidoreductase [Proteobacteria bacterium]|nr:FAD-binding oxidoreductase [Pseudomonadota bacterium]